ncbi:hypothetical protein J3Q64DRAFT_1702251 [Phycomyces blakesleeanus]|uniref:Uncharacterized protein n=2 Tax=Phycomyces blakesleeanus TaxID=4837 RepID=A0A167KLL7_PHYB8|nr:hypothetical protein PHYBLDRAFT_150555 [Phycomyces blakesleeanus NRRL 1555(-)]OAD68376.1 hypothetical protein PHYBLDRAFT_150555 [Phycomyces blakesleeanus NRRL 1555(-)]|eukprot:XP_018286416.1 hypothetical protein PHYBLDRAFT_150555 [Phycomyces blakesleeanus NRRL 1555(-)]
MINVSANTYVNEKSTFRFYSNGHVLSVIIYEEDGSIGYNCNPCSLTDADLFLMHEKDTMYFKIKGECTFKASVDSNNYLYTTCKINIDSNNTCLEIHLPSFEMKSTELRIESSSTDISSELFKVHELLYNISVLSDSDIQFLVSKEQDKFQTYTAVLAYHWNSLDVLDSPCAPGEEKTPELSAITLLQK